MRNLEKKVLLTELKKVIEIDGRISSLHQELSSLYEQRARFIQSPDTSAFNNHVGDKSEGTTTRHSKENWATQQYDMLAEAWGNYGIVIAPRSNLKKRLTRAREMITSLETINHELAGKLGVLLIPPAKLIGTPSATEHRKQQPHIKVSDCVNTDLSLKPGSKKDWRLVVAYMSDDSLEWGSAKDILVEKKYLVGGYDMRAIGVYEHFALSLQLNRPLDANKWVSLLKDCKPSSRLVPSVAFANGQYRYELDDAEGVFSDERFRPAIEVKI